MFSALDPRESLMRLLLCGLSTLLVSATAAPPPPQPMQVADSAVPTLDAEAYTRQLFSRFPERIVDVEERHSGPGAFLIGVTLYERPEAHHMAGLCQVRVHEVGVNTAPPPHNPPRYAESVRTSTRFFAIGPVNSSIPPADQRKRCSSLPSARNFFSASEDDARLALQTLTDARYFVTHMPRAISFSCESYRGACGEPAQLFMRHLTPDRVRSVTRIPCADGSTNIDEPCFRISFGDVGPGAGGDWSITTQGPRRPVRMHLEQSHPPVS